MPPYPGPEIEGGFELLESERVEGPDWDALSRRALEVAEADERVRERLGDARVAALGASIRGDVKKKTRVFPVFVLYYDYDAGVTVEVELAAEGDEMAVVGIQDADYQAAPSDEEIERAIELARADRRVTGRITRDLVPRVILVSDVEPGDRHHGTRRLEVAFGRPTERLPRLRTLVDLGAEQVLGVGVGVRHEIADAEGFADTLRAAEEDDE
jgi:hypothetical protein